MYCTHCGTLNEDRARYCKKCGTPLESPPKEEKTYSPDNRIQENTAAESPGRKWLLLAAGILGILLLIVPVYLFLSGRLESLLSGEKEPSGENFQSDNGRKYGNGIRNRRFPE